MSFVDLRNGKSAAKSLRPSVFMVYGKGSHAGRDGVVSSTEGIRDSCSAAKAGLYVMKKPFNNGRWRAMAA